MAQNYDRVRFEAWMRGQGWQEREFLPGIRYWWHEGEGLDVGPVQAREMFDTRWQGRRERYGFIWG